MRELTRIRLRTLVWLILPFTVVFLIPHALRRAAHESMAARGWSVWRWLGVWLMLDGLGLAAWCVNLFNVQGRGTPLPFDPPKQFVVKGPYQYVRNPMMLGAVVLMLGEAAFFQSGVLVLYAGALFGCAHSFVCYWEEPDLKKRFGDAYRAYCQHIPRWLPRFLPSRKPVTR